MSLPSRTLVVRHRRMASAAVLAAVLMACGPNEELPTVPPGSPTIDLSISLTVDDSIPLENATIRFTLEVVNLGPREATFVGAADTLPTGLTYVAHNASAGTTYSPDSGLWRIGTLVQNRPIVLTIDARVNSATAGRVLLNRAIVASVAMQDTVPGNNFDTVRVRPRASSPPPPPPPPGLNEPTFNAAVDSLIHTDNFDLYATPDDRFNRLTLLRNTQGPNTHTMFISDNRLVDAPPAAFYELHRIESPGFGGAGRALRGRYLDVEPNQYAAFRTWPTGPSAPYGPVNATVAITMMLRIREGWQINFPGFKFFEMWHVGGSRTQISLDGPPGAERFVVNPASRGGFGYQPAFATPRWGDINNFLWHRFTWVYRPNNVENDTTGIARLYINGQKVVDLSASGVTEGYCTLSEVRQLTTLPVIYLMWPDVLNTNLGRGIGHVDSDNLFWWVEKGP